MQPSKNASLLATLLCFITVTSKTTLSKMILSVRQITAVEAADARCGNSVSLETKDGKKICVLDSFPRIESSLKASDSCSL